jgi:type II secretory pathway pseudopilin PulG
MKTGQLRHGGPINLHKLVAGEAGITLVELLAGLGISVFVLAFVGTAVFQFYKVTGWGNDRMLLAANLQTAQLWLGRDAVQANSFTPGTSPVYGTLSIPTGGSPIQIQYSYDTAAHTLVRTDASGSQIVARDIANESDVSFSPSGQQLDVSLTSTRGSLTDTSDLSFALRVP